MNKTKLLVKRNIKLAEIEKDLTSLSSNTLEHIALSIKQELAYRQSIVDLQKLGLGGSAGSVS